MRCINPVEIGSNRFPCGRCNFCLESKRVDWSFRLSNELKRASTAKFVTLTYDDVNLPIMTSEVSPGVYGDFPSLSKHDVQLFKKRLRKANDEAYAAQRLVAPSVRYFTVGEYGSDTFRPHYHSILFNVHFKVLDKLPSIWQKGQVHVGTVTKSSIHYVTKYVLTHRLDCKGREPPFSLMSRRPGIGADYLRTHTEWHRADFRNFVNVNGFKSRLPRYYKDRIFYEEERAALAREMVELQANLLSEEFKRLAELHDDPYSHYVERVQNMHDAVTSKIDQNSKL